MNDPEVIRSHIMALIEANNTPVIGKTLFMYQIFLVFKEVSPGIGVTFFPYQLGPYSNPIAHEFNWLIDNGFIEVSKKGRNTHFTCTEKGKGYSKYTLKPKMTQIARIKKVAHNLGLKATMASFRLKYPQYMINSRV